MPDTFGFPPDLVLAMLAIAIAYFVLIHSPVLFALAIAWRQRKTMKRRILFVGAVMVGCYGLLALVLMALVVPAEVFAVFVVPTLKAQGYFEHSVFLSALDFIYSWGWLLLPAVILTSAIVTSRYLGSRWNRIVEALNG